MIWKITKNIDDLKHLLTPFGEQCFDISMTTDNPEVANYFKNYGIQHNGVPMYAVEEIAGE